MKKLVTICGVLVAALAAAGVAEAAAPEGHMTGGAVLVTLAPVGISSIIVRTTISDGSTDYVNVNNDKSGNCDGDVGRIRVSYVAVLLPAFYPITCAHYNNTMAGVDTMSVDYFDTRLNTWVVFRVQDRGVLLADRFTYSTTTSETNALNWVNLGTNGSGNSSLVPALLTLGNYNVFP